MSKEEHAVIDYELTDEGAIALAREIVKQAADDYRHMLRHGNKGQIQQAANWFKTKYADALCYGKALEIEEMIRREYEHEKRNRGFYIPRDFY